MRAPVLPGAEPKQNQMNMMLAGLRQQRVQHAVIKVVGLRFELLPINRHLDCVGVDELDRRPDFWQPSRLRNRIVSGHQEFSAATVMMFGFCASTVRPPYPK